MKRKCVDENFHFGANKDSLLLTNEALSYYQNHQLVGDNWLYDRNGLPIFIDTNVILDLYRTSIRAREQFLEFISQNAKRIHITGQVSHEYMKHRIGLIHEAQKKVEQTQKEVESIIRDIEKLQHSTKGRLSTWVNRRDVARDFTQTNQCINELSDYIDNNSICNSEDFKAIIQRTKDSITPDVESLKSQLVTEQDDKILSVLTKTNIMPPLSQEEQVFLNHLYKELWTIAKPFEGKEDKQELYAFPGRGDHEKLEKGEDPCGDLYIYHEMLSYISEHGTDAIFLTGDVAKKDWLQPNGAPYMHYIIDNYNNAGHLIHIRNAREFSFGIYADIDDMIKDLMKEYHELSASISGLPLERGPIDGAEEQIHNEVHDQTASISADDNYYTSYIKITRGQFLEELKKSLRWAKSYGNGYISLNFFIRDILGNKGFDIRTSYAVKDELLSTKEIIVKQIEEEGHMFNAIELANMQEIEETENSGIEEKEKTSTRQKRAQRTTHAKTPTQRDLDEMNKKDN